eukprot:Skav218984  [mRNA]  locus=scaffold1532:488515:489742:- [translate_table: standard]
MVPATNGPNAKTSAKCCELLATMASSRLEPVCGRSVACRVQSLLCCSRCEGILDVLGCAWMCLLVFLISCLVGEAACSALPWLLQHQRLGEMLHELAKAEITQITRPSAKRLRNFVDTLALLFDECDSEDPLVTRPETMSARSFSG